MNAVGSLTNLANFPDGNTEETLFWQKASLMRKVSSTPNKFRYHKK